MSADIILVITILTLAGVVVYQGWFIKKLMDKHDKERDGLLNRIQCRDYAQLVQGDIAHKQVERALTAEEIAEMQAERGIPV